MPTAIGILGGTFNPIHVGHVRLARAARDLLRLDRVELIPCATPPHKPVHDLLPFALRLDLAALAVADEPGLRANGMEGERPGPSYTVDTLAALRRAEPDAELYFLLGATDLPALPGWHRGADIPGLANLAVVPRDRAGEEAIAAFAAGRNLPEIGGPEIDVPETEALAPSLRAWGFPEGTRLIHLPAQRTDVSASAVRATWLAGEPVDDLVPPSVAHALDAHRDAVRSAWAASAKTSI